MRAARLSAELVLYRLRLPRKLRDESLTEILGEALAGLSHDAASGEPDPSARVALRAAESLVSRSRIVANTCLYRALGRYRLFRRAGYRAVFVMAIRRDEDGGEGHAWIEFDGVPWRERVAPELIVTLRYPE